MCVTAQHETAQHSLCMIHGMEVCNARDHRTLTDILHDLHAQQLPSAQWVQHRQDSAQHSTACKEVCGGLAKKLQ
jgi:hypothetical protein